MGPRPYLLTRYKGGSVTSGGVPLGTVEPRRGCSGVTWPMMPEKGGCYIRLRLSWSAKECMSGCGV